MLSRYTMVFAMAMLLIAGVCGSVLALTEEEMKAVNQGLTDALNAHNPDQWVSYFTDDGVWDYVPGPPPASGKDAVRALMGVAFEAFPDMQFHYSARLGFRQYSY